MESNLKTHEIVDSATLRIGLLKTNFSLRKQPFEVIIINLGGKKKGRGGGKNSILPGHYL